MGQSKRQYNRTIPVFGGDRKEMKQDLEQISFNKEKGGQKWQPKKTDK